MEQPRRTHARSLTIVLVCGGLLWTTSSVAQVPLLSDLFAVSNLEVSPDGVFHEATVGDADNDGSNELVISLADSRLQVIQTHRDGSWTLEREIPLPAQLTGTWTSPHVVDVDGDGDFDIGVWWRANSQRGLLAVAYYDQGDYSVVTYPTPETDAGWGMAMADIGGDGLPEILTTNGGFHAPGTVFITQNSPMASLRFATYVALPTNSDATKAYAFDLDLDGDQDVAAATHDTGAKSASLFFNLGSGFAPLDLVPGDSTLASFITFGDLDNDADIDVVTNATVPHQVRDYLYVYPRETTGYGAPFKLFTSGVRPDSQRVADLDLDGLKDLVVSVTSNRTLDFFFGRSDTQALDTTPQTLSAPELAAIDHGYATNPNTVVVGDVENDGDVDVLVSSTSTVLVQNQTVALASCNPGGAPLYAVSALPAGVNPAGVAIGDFDHDGNQDLAVSNNGAGTVGIYLGNGAGGFAAASPLVVGAQPQQVGVADFDDDGNLDVAIARSAPANNVTIALGDGAGAFSVAGEFSTLSRPLSLAIADFDADGAPDVATHSLDADAVSVLWGDGAGGLDPRSDFAAGVFPGYVVAADFDGDSLPDLACTNRESDTVSVLLSLGARQFGQASFIPVGDGPDSLTAADFNGDGSLDLAVATNIGDQIDILLGQGDGSFVPAMPLTGVNSGPHSIASADVDLDGATDLVFNNNHRNLTIDFRSLSIARGDGAGGFSVPVNYPVGKQPNYLAVGDLNGDGVPDVAVPNLNSNDLTLLSSLPPCTVEWPATQDSFIRRGAPDTNEGANPNLRIQSTGKNRVLVGFDPSAIRTEGLIRAELVLTISDIADNWGTSGRTVNAHRLLAPWTEGNGWSVGGDGRGEGPGVTWACATDEEIANQVPDCGEEWDGALFAPAIGPGALHTNGMTGEVAWDVTSDLLAGAAYGWILVKDLENQNGKVFYHSRESASAAGDLGLAPRLGLEYAP